VLVPMFNEEDVLPTLVARIRPVLDGLSEPYELLAVDDGSSDGTARLLASVMAAWPELRMVRLLTNSGHQAAISAGFTRARGHYVVTMDADLQDPPEVIPELLAVCRRSGVDVVYGVRSDRSSDTRAKRWTASLYYKLVRRLVGRSVTPDAGDFRLVSRRVVDAVNLIPRDGMVFRLLIPWLGFPSATVGYVRAPRAAGKTKYPVTKMVRLAVDSVTAFSAAPLRLATWLGVSGGLMCICLLFSALVIKFTGHSVPGWTSLVFTVTVIGAIQLICLGLLGEYVARLFHLSQGRPTYLVGYDSLGDRQTHDQPLPVE
jgi:dolichol-phosphate mannosyltransferase